MGNNVHIHVERFLEDSKSISVHILFMTLVKNVNFVRTDIKHSFKAIHINTDSRTDMNE